MRERTVSHSLTRESNFRNLEAAVFFAAAHCARPPDEIECTAIFGVTLAAKREGRGRGGENNACCVSTPRISGSTPAGANFRFAFKSAMLL